MSLNKKACFIKGYLGIKMLIMFLLFCNFSVYSQFQNNELLYISDNTSLFVGNGVTSFNFGATGLTTTTRTNSTYGKIVFDNSVVTNGASDTHFLDGYATIARTTSFLMPLGQTNTYAPIELIPNTNTAVDAAYFRSNPSGIGSAIGVGVNSISSIEYWDIKGATSSVISLSWRSTSDILTLTNSDLSNLIIVGFNGVEWVEIPSTVDILSFLGSNSDLNNGSITTSSNVDLTLYSGFTLGSKIGFTCLPVVASSGNVKTWNGTWSPSSPTINDPVVINAPYSGNLECNSLVLNSDITINDGEYVDVVFDVTGSGKINMSSESSFVQRDNLSQPPTINLIKKTRSIRWNDYTYFGTPVSNNFYSDLLNAQATTGTLTGALDGFYSLNSGINPGWVPLTNTTAGRGFIARVKNQAPFLNNYSINDVINVPINGVANNGDITVTVNIDNSAPSDDEANYSLLANPYPSAINGDKFLIDNPNIDGVLYIWQAQTIPFGTTGFYSQSDYVTYTRAGVTYPVPSGIANTFQGKIASGQGFVVLGLANNSPVTFTNCMRLKGDNDNFNKNSDVQNNRFKINLTNDSYLFSQILIGYYPEATLGYDRTFDARRNSINAKQIFSFTEESDSELAINARPTFTDTDVVPLGIIKENSEPEQFTISLDEKEGIFSDDDVTVYLHDKLLNTVHNLEDSSYNFTTESTSLTNRFEIIYQNSTLNNPEFSMNDLIASIKNNKLNIQSTKEIKLIRLYDMTGREIGSHTIENMKEITKPFLHAEGIYIIKVFFSDDTVGSKKLINRK